MKRSIRRIFAVVIALAVAASLMMTAPVSTSALSYSGSASYMSGPYYSKLCAVNLTGNQRVDIVNVAKSQIGYQEGNNNSQLAGTVKGSKNYTEYGPLTKAQGQYWCAAFVSWCAYVAGIPTSVVPRTASTVTGYTTFSNKGLAVSRATVASGGYTPQSGDIVYFKGTSNDNIVNHIGIVTGYSGSTLYTIEGNTSSTTFSTNGGCVAAKSYSISNTKIRYICRPNYSSSGGGGGGSITPTVNSNFEFNVEGASAAPGGVAISGWCYDKRNTSVSLGVHVYFGGPAGDANAEGNPFTNADVTRTDVDNVHHCGANHGFDTTVYTSKRGSTPVYIYAVNPSNGESTLMHSFTANISNRSDFNFNFEGFGAVSGGGVAIEGWVYDKNNPGESIGVHTYIGGRPGTEGAFGHPFSVADKERTDVDNVHHCGTHHGFQNTIYSGKTGSQPVYVYAVSPSSGESVEMFSFMIDIPVPSNPEGVVDNISAEPGKIRVKGWTFDRDDFSSLLDVHVYIGGPAGSQNADVRGIKADKLRADVDNVHHCGTNHGFDEYIGTNRTGIQDVYIYGINVRGGQNVLLGSGQVAIPADTEAPVVTETGIDHVTNDSYRVSCKVTDNSEIDRVEVWTWTRQQTDMEVYDAEWGENGEFYVDIDRSNHASTFNNLYHNHIFAYDVSGNVVKAVQDYDYQITSYTGKNVSEGTYRIVSAADESKGLDIYAASTEDDANVHVYPNLTDPNQTFALSYVGDGFYTIKNTHADKCLDVHGCTYQDGTNVAIWGANGDVNQNWEFRPTDDGCFNIIARNNGLALTVQSDDDVKVNALNNSAAQKWKLRRILNSSASISIPDQVTVSVQTPRPLFSLLFGTATLVEDTDFTVSTVNLPQGEGTGSVTLTGKGGYCESITKTFSVSFKQCGDVDGSKSVTVNDATLLQRYFAEFDDLTGEGLELADANRDGVVNIRDVTAMQRHIAEYHALPRIYHYE